MTSTIFLLCLKFFSWIIDLISLLPQIFDWGLRIAEEENSRERDEGRDSVELDQGEVGEESSARRRSGRPVVRTGFFIIENEIATVIGKKKTQFT